MRLQSESSVRRGNTPHEGIVMVSITWLRRWWIGPETCRPFIVAIHHNGCVGIEADARSCVPERQPTKMIDHAFGGVGLLVLGDI